MIGLGSNRLTVCRRGGMSVTQAGRGGMEWLAGGRRPRWSSPYSAQATAALKAQFPTQWPTIRDYGFAHPEIVGYMNAYAPEDAKIAYSLVPTLNVYRWISNGGSAYIDLGLKGTTDDVAKISAKLNSTAKGALFGSRTSATSNAFGIGTDNGPRWIADFGDYMVTRLTLENIDTSTIYDVTISKSLRKINSAESTAQYTGTVLTPTNLYLFWAGPNYFTTDKVNAKIKYFELEGKRLMYPFIRKINGVDVCGMIDVLSGTFYQNAGSGSFTISENPS